MYILFIYLFKLHILSLMTYSLVIFRFVLLQAKSMCQLHSER